jgi:chorismate--pyruvate lyase
MYGWRTITQENLHLIPAILFDWIVKINHLKLAMTQQGLKPELILLDQRHDILPDDEATLVQAHQGLIRQIYLADNNQPLTYGRTIVPEQTYQAFAHQFETLGIRAIGETLLHDKDNVVRGAFEFGFVAADTELFQAAIQKYDQPLDGLWGRRSLFFINGYPLLITELFFPNLPQYEMIDAN